MKRGKFHRCKDRRLGGGAPQNFVSPYKFQKVDKKSVFFYKNHHFLKLLSKKKALQACFGMKIEKLSLSVPKSCLVLDGLFSSHPVVVLNYLIE